MSKSICLMVALNLILLIFFGSPTIMAAVSTSAENTQKTSTTATNYKVTTTVKNTEPKKTATPVTTSVKNTEPKATASSSSSNVKTSVKNTEPKAKTTAKNTEPKAKTPEASKECFKEIPGTGILTLCSQATETEVQPVVQTQVVAEVQPAQTQVVAIQQPAQETQRVVMMISQPQATQAQTAQIVQPVATANTTTQPVQAQANLPTTGMSSFLIFLVPALITLAFAGLKVFKKFQPKKKYELFT